MRRRRTPARHSLLRNCQNRANSLVLWIASQSGAIVVGQFINGRPRCTKSAPVARPPFDGQWMWTDGKGGGQPASALFRGLFSEDNPYLGALEPAYRELAEAMRVRLPFQGADIDDRPPIHCGLRRVLFRRFWQDPWLFQAGEALQGLRHLLAAADGGRDHVDHGEGHGVATPCSCSTGTPAAARASA